MAVKKTVQNPVKVAGKGRPAKDAAVYIGGVLVMSSADNGKFNALAGELIKDGKKLEELVFSAVKKHFALGKIVSAAAEKLPRGFTNKDLAEALKVQAGVIGTSYRVYRKFMDCPEALEGLTLREVAALISDRKPGEGAGRERVEYSLPVGQLEDLSDSFGLPTLSGVRLESHRLRYNQGEFYLIRKGFNVPLPVVRMTVEQPRSESMEGAFSLMRDEVQKALERYYKACEDAEEEDF